MAPRGGRILVTSSAEPSSARMLELGGTVRAIKQAPYFSLEEVQDMLAQPEGPPESMRKAWAVFIRSATGGGHPLLVAAKVMSLRARTWPPGAILEDFGPGVSVTIRTTRDGARRQLLSELSELGDVRSLSAGSILRRIACIFDRVDVALATKLGRSEPAIESVGDALAVLRGAWLEPLPAGDFRVSPLLGDIASDVSVAEANR